MKSYIKYLLLLSAGLFVLSCNKKEEYTWAEPDAEDGKVEVFFATSGETVELDPADEVYTVTINRKDATGDLSVPIVVKWNQKGAFGVPATAEFADGSATATIDIDVKGALVGEQYTLELGLPDDNYYIYKPLGVAGAISYKLIIQKLKWTDICTGTYTPAALVTNWGYSALPGTLQKCESVEGRYRIANVFCPGGHVVFSLVGDEQTDKGGDKFYTITAGAQSTGTTLLSFGTLYFRDVATWQGDTSWLENSYYYPDYNEVYIFMQYFVSAGNAGYGTDSFKPAS